MANYELKLKYSQNIFSSNKQSISSLDVADGACKIHCVCWSHDGNLFAFVNAARKVFIYDMNDPSTPKETFSLKPRDKSNPTAAKGFVSKGIAFHPQGTKIAIAQSDDVVYMYRFQSSPGVWDGKKTICNKFALDCSPTCIYWPRLDLSPEFDKAFYVGTVSGEVRKCKTNVKKTKEDFLLPQKITSSQSSLVCALASLHENAGFVASYGNGLIIVWNESNGHLTNQVTMRHPVACYALASTAHAIVAGGADSRVAIYNRSGELIQSFDYSTDRSEKEFACACSSYISDTIAIGSFDRVRLFNWNSTSDKFVELKPMEIYNLCTITSISWRPDGTNVLVGTMTGFVEMFEVSSPKSVVNGIFEIQYFGPKQVVVKNTKKNSRAVLRSQYNYPITKVNVCGGKSSGVQLAHGQIASDKQNRFLVAYTSDTLLIADFSDGKLSEVQWRSGGNEKFYFEIDKVCVIFNAGEMSIIEYGNNDFLGSVRTEFTSPHQFSVRINERQVIMSDMDIKKLAYLVDLKTVEIVDLMYEEPSIRITHPHKIKWVELNETGRKLLFRDVKFKLFLFDLTSEEKTTMLNFCQFVQWVPQSDVVVAQNREFLCVWYNIDSPDKISMFPIKGEVREVVRKLVTENNKEKIQTAVIVDEKLPDLAEYLLDSDLIAFGTAVDAGHLTVAMEYLENLEATPETAAHWRTLAKLALEQSRLPIAERCFAELGDVSKSRYVRNLINTLTEHGHISDELIQDEVERAVLWRTVVDSDPEVKAKLHMMHKQFFHAQSIFMENDMLDKAINMFITIGKWDQALQLAEERSHPEVDRLRRQCKEFLTSTNQLDKLAQMHANDGRHEEAVLEYVKAGMPGKAANHLMKRPALLSQASLLDAVQRELLHQEFYNKSGELYEKSQNYEKAVSMYRKAMDKEGFANAVRVARENNVGVDVRQLLEEYAEFLYDQMEFEMAMEKYLQATLLNKALKCAFRSNNMARAEEIFETIRDSPNGPESFQQGAVNEGDLTYDGWAIKLGQHYAQLRTGNKTANLKKAQSYFIEANSLDHIIQMYKDAGDWRTAYDYLTQIGDEAQAVNFIKHEANKCKKDGRLTEAERMFIHANMHQEAIDLYKDNGDYNSVLRIQREFGIGDDQNTLLEHAERCKREGDITEAERLYLEAGQWREAVAMYMQQSKWEDARRVCQLIGNDEAKRKEAFIGYCWAKDLLSVVNAAKLLQSLNLIDSVIDVACNTISNEIANVLGQSFMNVLAKSTKSIPDFQFALELAEKVDRDDLIAKVRLAWGQFYEDNGEFKKAEKEFVAAGKPNEALLMYIHEQLLDDAQRVAEQYCSTEEKNQVYLALGNKKFEKGEYEASEKLFLKSGNIEYLVNLYIGVNRMDKVKALADKGLLTAEQVQALSRERREDSVNQLQEANQLATKLSNPESLRQALAIYLSLEPKDLEKMQRGGLEGGTTAEQLLHINAQSIKLTDTLCVGESGFIENLYLQAPVRDQYGSVINMKLSEVVEQIMNKQKQYNGDWKKPVSLCLTLYTALNKIGESTEAEYYIEQAIVFACSLQQYKAAVKIINHTFDESSAFGRRMLQYVKDEAVNSSRKQGDYEKLVEMGEGFEDLKATGNYERYLELVRKKDRENNTNNLKSSIRKSIRDLLNQLDADPARKNDTFQKLFFILTEYGPLAEDSENILGVYKAIFDNLTSTPCPHIDKMTVDDYNAMLFKNEWVQAYKNFDKLRRVLLTEIESNAYGGKILHRLSVLFQAAHIYASRAVCMTSLRLIPTAAKLSMSLVGLIYEIPADKVFLEAGAICRLAATLPLDELSPDRKTYLIKMAYLFFNTFIDVVEQAQEGAMEFSSEFFGDIECVRDHNIIVPRDPNECVLKDESLFEEFKDWVLTTSMNNEVDIGPDMSVANNATDDNMNIQFEACASNAHICCISGYPVFNPPHNLQLRSIGTVDYSVISSEKGLLQTAKMVGGMSASSKEDRETIKRLTNDNLDFCSKSLGLHLGF